MIHDVSLNGQTPAFIFNQKIIEDNCRLVRGIADKTRVKFLYALKALAFSGATKVIAKYANGFAASSLFEARLAKELSGCDGTVHLTAPGFRDDEISELSSLCNYVAFNSLSQWKRF